MDRNAVIIVTGAAGFIGSCLTGYLNRKGYYNIIIVDDFDDETKKHNYDEKKICARVDKEELFEWLSRYKIRIDFVFHLGAYTQATGINDISLHEMNADYSEKVWNYCTDKKIPLVYASFDSSPAVADDRQKLTGFDQWVSTRVNEKKPAPPFWAGLSLSHVYGPNEYHKGEDASPVFRFFEQMIKEKKIKLSVPATTQQNTHGPVYDFVYVKDVVDVCYWFMQKSAEDQEPLPGGFYDVGSGFTHSFEEVAAEIFKVTGREPLLEYTSGVEKGYPAGMINIANISRLREAGYKKEFYSLSDGVRTYITHFLTGNKYY